MENLNLENYALKIFVNIYFMKIKFLFIFYFTWYLGSWITLEKLVFVQNRVIRNNPIIGAFFFEPFQKRGGVIFARISLC